MDDSKSRTLRCHQWAYHLDRAMTWRSAHLAVHTIRLFTASRLTDCQDSGQLRSVIVDLAGLRSGLGRASFSPLATTTQAFRTCKLARYHASRQALGVWQRIEDCKYALHLQPAIRCRQKPSPASLELSRYLVLQSGHHESESQISHRSSKKGAAAFIATSYPLGST